MTQVSTSSYKIKKDKKFEKKAASSSLVDASSVLVIKQVHSDSSTKIIKDKKKSTPSKEMKKYTPC